MDSHIFVSRHDDASNTWDIGCLVCGDELRLSPNEGFVSQVRVFLEEHRHPDGER